MTLVEGITPDNGSWDVPIGIEFVMNQQWMVDAKKDDVVSRLSKIQKEGFNSFWVYYDISNYNNNYNLYIGYC